MTNRKSWFGVHDFHDCAKNKWSHVIHFHKKNKHIFKLGRTENGDGFGYSCVMNYRNERPTEDYESFQRGGYIYSKVKPKDIERPDLTNDDEIDEFAEAHNGEITET
jgi:hypothetical protein